MVKSPDDEEEEDRDIADWQKGMEKNRLRSGVSVASEPVINPPLDDDSVASTNKGAMDVDEDNKLLLERLAAAAAAEEQKKRAASEQAAAGQESKRSFPPITGREVFPSCPL